MDREWFDLGSNRTTRLLAIILIVIIYYVITFYVSARFGPGFLIAMLALPYPILFLFLRGCEDREIANIVWVLVIAYLLAAFLFIFYAFMMRLSGNHMAAFIFTLLTWLIISAIIIVYFRRNGLDHN